jgi:hypothetical protein
VGSRLQGGVRVALALALVALAGCYWSKYDKLSRTHVQLLLSMAQKLDAVTRAEGAPPSALAEYRYPLERARDFIRIVAPRFEDRRSLQALRRCCDAYERALHATERLDTDDSPQAHAAVEEAQADLQREAAAALRALDAEAAR